MPVDHQPLPGGYSVGEQLFYTGPSVTKSQVQVWLYGERGDVVGPATSSRLVGKGLSMLFPSSTKVQQISLVHLSRAQPPYPGGFSIGETLYLIRHSHWFASGEHMLAHGARGRVVRPSCEAFDDTLGSEGSDELLRANPLSPYREDLSRGIAMRFSGHDGLIHVRSAQLSRTHPPKLLGGYDLGDTVHYIGPSFTYHNGQRVEYGQRGEVIGPGGPGEFGQLLAVLADKDRDAAGALSHLEREFRPIYIGPESLSRQPAEPLAGGFKPGDKVYYTGTRATVWSCAEGVVHTCDQKDKDLLTGVRGEVVGLGEEDVKTFKVLVQFGPEVATFPLHVNVFDLSRKPLHKAAKKEKLTPKDKALPKEMASRKQKALPKEMASPKAKASPPKAHTPTLETNGPGFQLETDLAGTGMPPSGSWDKIHKAANAFLSETIPSQGDPTVVQEVTRLS